MMRRRTQGIIVIVCFTWLAAACSIWVEQPRGSLVLTFDDTVHIGSWKTGINTIEQYGGVATFFLDRPHRLSSSDVEWLLEIESRGHEIGFHGTHHGNAMMMVYFDGLCLDEYIAREIEPGVNQLRDMGLSISSFAYPYGHHSASIDEALRHQFTVLRGVTPLAMWAVEPYGRSGFYKAASMDVHADGREHISMSAIRRAMRVARALDHAFILYGHDTPDVDRDMAVPLARLEAILSEAVALGLGFKTMSQLAEP